MILFVSSDNASELESRFSWNQLQESIFGCTWLHLAALATTRRVERKKKILFSREKVGLTNFRIFSLQT
jgi:hypothetical protein